MASLQKYDDSASIVSVFTTELDSLANNAMAISSGITPGGDLFCDMELAVKYTSSTPATATSVAKVYFLVSVDGTNYPEGSTTVIPVVDLKVADFHSRNPSTSTVERLIIPRINMPPRTFKVLIQNTSGKTFGSSGNTLKFKPYKYNLNG